MQSTEQRRGSSASEEDIELNEASQALLGSDTGSIWQHDPDLTLQINTAHGTIKETAQEETSAQRPIQSPPLIQALPPRERYASKELLCPWVPEADPNSKQARTLTRWLTRRKSVLIFACITSTLVFLANLVSVIVVRERPEHGRLYQGSCKFASRLDSGLHVLINVLSSLLLGASNLCMQLLAAPTRKEVDEAHSNRKWLDIGRPSIRNLKHIARERTVVWLMLAIGGIPLHLLYNSAIISVLPVNSYNWAVVTPGFLNGDAFDVSLANATMVQRTHSNVSTVNFDTTPPKPVWGNLSWPGGSTFLEASTKGKVDGLRASITLGELTYMTKVECLTGYANATRDLSDVVLVASGDVLDPEADMASMNNSLLAFAPAANPLNSQDGKWRWICGVSNSFNCGRPDLWLNNPTVIADWNVYAYKIDHCLSRRQNLDQLCSVDFSVPIMVVVTVANLFKCICIFYTTWLYATENDATPLSTLGDAAVSFLKTPDETTNHLSLADRTNIDEVWRKPMPQAWRPSRKRWGRVTSLKLWGGTIAACLAVLIGGFVCLATGLQTVARRTNVAPWRVYLPALGFGSPNQYESSSLGKYATYHWSSSRALYISIAWANCWQVLVSLCYVQYNTLLTTFLVGQEWSQFACATTSSHPKTVQDESRDTEKLVAKAYPRGPKPSGFWSWIRIFISGDRDEDLAASRVRRTLRVSEPQGIQRSTYFVSMPTKYGLPLISAMAAMHFLLSQSIFVIATDAYKYGNTAKSFESVYLSGFSIQALITTICLGFILIVALFIFGLRRYPKDMPMVSTCSAAISAACHPPADDNEAYLFPLQWGVVSHDENGVGHCSLTTARDVTAPEEGRLYA